MSSPSDAATEVALVRGRLVETSDASWAEVVARSEQEPVLVYFSATWCGPCKVFGPLLDQYVTNRRSLLATKLDGDENPAATSFCDVEAFPHMSVLRHGTVRWVLEDSVDEALLAPLLDTVLAAMVDAPPGPRAETGAGAEPVGPLHFPDLSGTTVVVGRSGGGAAEQIGTAGPQTVVLGPDDELDLLVSADARLPRPLDLSVLRELPPVAFATVTVEAERLPGSELAHLRGLTSIGTLVVISSAPLDAEALSALTEVRASRLRVLAPGLDAVALAARMPGRRVNGIATDAAVAAKVAEVVPVAPVPTFTAPAQLRSAVAAGGHVLAMVQAEHEDDVDVAYTWHEAVRAGEVPTHAVAVSAHGDAELLRGLGLEARRPVLVAYEGGRLVWRASLPFSVPAVGPTVSGSGSQEGATAQPRPWPARGARSITPGEAAGRTRVVVDLVPPGSVGAGASFALRPGRVEPVPAGWSVRCRWQVWEDPEVPWVLLAEAGVEDLELQVVRHHDVVDLGGLVRLPDLVDLALDLGPATGTFVAEVAPELTHLRRLRLDGASEVEVARVREVLAATVVNGSMPLGAERS